MSVDGWIRREHRLRRIILGVIHEEVAMRH